MVLASGSPSAPTSEARLRRSRLPVRAKLDDAALPTGKPKPFPVFPVGGCEDAGG